MNRILSIFLMLLMISVIAMGYTTMNNLGYAQDGSLNAFSGVSILALNDDVYSNEGAADLSGISGKPVNLTVATTPPEIVSVKLDDTSVLTGDYIANNPTVNIVATDDSNVAFYRIQVLDTNGVLVAGNDTGIVTLNTQAASVAINAQLKQALSNGSYIIKATIYIRPIG